MGVKKVLKKTIGGGLNVKNWVGYDNLKDNTRVVGHLAKGVFKREQKEPIKESFDEALKRLNLSEDDLKQRMKTAKQVTLFCLSLSGLILLYTLYLLSKGQLLSSVMSLMLTCISGVYALREHFNLYQMRQRRLGCSFQEYVSSLIGKGKK